MQTRTGRKVVAAQFLFPIQAPRLSIAYPATALALIEVESVQYRDREDNVQTLAAANY